MKKQQTHKAATCQHCTKPIHQYPGSVLWVHSATSTPTCPDQDGDADDQATPAAGTTQTVSGPAPSSGSATPTV